jgi:hypothetical protein
MYICFTICLGIRPAIVHRTGQLFSLERWILMTPIQINMNAKMEIRVSMVEDGPDCCRSGRRVHIDRLVSSGRWAPVQFGVAKAHLKHALSSAA